MGCLFYFEWLIWGKKTEPFVIRGGTLNQGMWWVTIKQFHRAPSLKKDKNNIKKKKSWLVRPTFQSSFIFPPQSCPADWGNFFCVAGEWSGHVCQWQGSLFSLITSFTNLQIYTTTLLCVKESMPSPAAWSLDLWWQQDQWSYSVEWN